MAHTRALSLKKKRSATHLTVSVVQRPYIKALRSVFLLIWGLFMDLFSNMTLLLSILFINEDLPCQQDLYIAQNLFTMCTHALSCIRVVPSVGNC